MADPLTGAARPLRLAIIGAGPGGLGAAIALSRLPNIELLVFEQARELREIGAGININQNTWRLLKWFGADKNLDAFYKSRDDNAVDIQHRNGRTAELLSQRLAKEGTPNGPPQVRIERYKLQNALLKEVPAGLIQLRKRLVHLEHTPKGVSLRFEDGTGLEEVDLVIGADGIRSVVRGAAFPDHHVSYTGKIAYRVLINQDQIAHIEGIPKGPTFWQTPTTHVYTCFLDEGKFEIATRAIIPAEQGTKVSWGQAATKEEVVKHYDEYHPIIRQVIEAPASWLQFALFGGPRLESVIAEESIALIGDASHPLSGAFGSGAAFAFEDVFALQAALKHARARGQNLGYALKLFDEVRSPHYEKLFGVLEAFARVAKEVGAADPPLSPDDLVRTRLKRTEQVTPTAWIYEYDITKAWTELVGPEEPNTEPLKEKNTVTTLNGHKHLAWVGAVPPPTTTAIRAVV